METLFQPDDRMTVTLMDDDYDTLGRVENAFPWKAVRWDAHRMILPPLEIPITARGKIDCISLYAEETGLTILLRYRKGFLEVEPGDLWIDKGDE